MHFRGKKQDFFLKWLRRPFSSLRESFLADLWTLSAKKMTFFLRLSKSAERFSIETICELWQVYYGSRHPELRTSFTAYVLPSGCQHYRQRGSGSGIELGSARFSF